MPIRDLIADDGTVLPGAAILVVDDEEVFRDRLARAFRDRGLETYVAATPTEAIDIARSASPDLAVVDLRLSGGSGLEVLRQLITLDSPPATVVLTGYGSISTAMEAARLGALGYVTKPADADDVLAAFAAAAAEKRASTEIQTPTLARVEWEHIQRVLDDCGGNVSVAARKLGMHRRSLQRKLRKYAPRD